MKTPSATWTYTITDNPMDLTLGMVGDIGWSTATGIASPIIKMISKFRGFRVGGPRKVKRDMVESDQQERNMMQVSIRR